MNRSLRQTLADSHVAAIAILLLLFWSFQWTIEALWEPVSRLAKLLFIAVAILDIPYISPTLDPPDRLMFINACWFFFFAMSSITAAWLLSHWTYGEGPFRGLSRYRALLAKRGHA
jgi:hypothetical protein